MDQDDTALHQLYPFLHGGKQDKVGLDVSLSESVRQKMVHHHRIVEAFFAEHTPAVVAAARSIADTYRSDGRLLVMGNGGSSCDASHITVEFQHPITAGRPALTAIDLTADRAMLTAVVVGGLGSLRGAVIAGLLIGVIYSLGIQFVPQFSDAIIYMIMAATLIFRL